MGVFIWIGGDLAPTRENAAAFAAGDVRALFGAEFLARWAEGDARVFNLETVLSDGGAPLPKAGPNLRAPAECAAGLRALAPSAICLANNHAMDFGAPGLRATQKALSGLNTFGAGETLAQASQAQILGDAAIYACAEREFGIADIAAPGTNPFDPLESFDAVAALRAQGHRVIVLYHGGLEKYRYPSPNLRRVCRKFVEKGADLVLCQHSHSVGCREAYQGKTIVYGQGNLLFARYSDEHWNTGLLIGVDTRDMRPVFVPLERREGGVRVSTDASILEGFEARSREIAREGFVEEALAQPAPPGGYFKIIDVRRGPAGPLCAQTGPVRTTDGRTIGGGRGESTGMRRAPRIGRANAAAEIFEGIARGICWQNLTGAPQEYTPARRSEVA